MKELFPSNYTALLTGPPGIGKFEYCLDTVKYYLEKGEGVVFITTERSPREIKERAKATGLEIEDYEGKKFLFIDIYSHSTGEMYEKGLNVDNPANLNLISINLEKASETIGKPIRVIFDSLSTLFLHVSVGELKKFFGVLSSRIKTEYGFIVYTLQEEMHDAQTVIALKHIVDCVLEMKFEEGPPLKRMFRVHHAKGISTTPTWYEFELAKEGFKLLGEVKAEKPVEAAPTREVVVEKPAVVPSMAIKIGVPLLLILIFGGVVFQFVLKGTGPESEKTTIEEELMPGETKDITLLTTGRFVTIAGKTEPADIYVRNRVDSKAPDKGWLVMETPYYKIEVNMDRPYYMLFDKINDKSLLVYNDTVENRIDMLTGADIGFADYDGENKVGFSTTARDDSDGIVKYSVAWEDMVAGFLLINTEGWDFNSPDAYKGYDVEVETMFGLFADKPYFIDITEVNNLQRQGLATVNEVKDPDNVIKSWVITDKYGSGVVKGGDFEHLNKQIYLDWYGVQDIWGARKLWHSGSAAFSKMFPDHVLIGNKLGGAIIFSLPQGKFRFRDELGIKGEQLCGEFIINVEEPQRAIAFTVDAINEREFFYDTQEFYNPAKTEMYNASLKEITERYGLEYLGKPINAHDWQTKRFAYVITLTKEWYDPANNKAQDRAWELAGEGLEDFKKYEDIIYEKMEATKPLRYAGRKGAL